MLGLILGSGLASFADHLADKVEIPFSEAGVPESKVPGHVGKFIRGKLGDQPVLLAQGRIHLYEGWSAHEITAGVRWMAEQGVKRLILTNAAGTLNHSAPPGSWMMITDHLNLTGRSPLTGGPHFIDLSEVYSLSWRERTKAAAQKLGITLHEGIYAGVSGPQYETPAEVRMLKTLGAHAVGMSTVLEAIQARALGLEVAGFSCLTNWACGLADSPLNHEEVLEVGKKAASELVRLLLKENGA